MKKHKNFLVGVLVGAVAYHFVGAKLVSKI